MISAATFKKYGSTSSGPADFLISRFFKAFKTSLLKIGEKLKVGLSSHRRGDGFGISLTEISLKIEPEEIKCLLKLFTISVLLVMRLSFTKI